MKQCSRCKKEKPLEEFNFKKKALNKRQKSCKACTRSEVRNHYLKNRPYYLEKAYTQNKKNRAEIHKYIWEFLLAHPCIDCGEKDPIVLDFDHQKDKITDVSIIVKGNYPLATIKKEIEKCLVRCANCHRRKTARDFNWYKHKFALVA